MNDRKKMIMDAFWELLDELPYNKITVRLIVERCGVNRNTFYYYFQDIPALAEEILNNQIDLLIEKHCRVGSLEECISFVVRFFIENKQIAMHLYRALPRDVFIRHLDRLLYRLTDLYLENITAALNLEIENKEMVVRFFKCLLVGSFLDWLDHGMSYDLLNDCMMFCHQQKGASLQFLLHASANGETAERWSTPTC